jgi:hypothetical protein
LQAALGDAGDDCRALFRVELAGGEVVEKEQRLRALDDEVVDAHGDEIDADGIVDAGFDRDLQLGPHAVIGGDQHRIGKARRLQVEQAAKAADLAIRTRPPRRPHQRLDAVDHLVAGIDVNARLGVGEAVLRIRHLGFPSLGFQRSIICRGDGILRAILQAGAWLQTAQT